MLRFVLPRALAVACFLACVAYVFRPASAEGPKLSPVVERTLAEVGRTRVIAFRVSEPAAEDASFEATVEKPELLEVVLAPAVLKGESLGWIRVRGLAAGETALRIGDASMKIAVVEPRAEPPVAQRPVLTTPADGACAWRTIAVGMEIDAEAAGEGARHELRLSSGDVVRPTRISGALQGPTLRVRFDVNVRKLPEGALELTPVTVRKDSAALKGDTTVIRVLKPEAEAIVQMEAEDQRETKRPERFMKNDLFVGTDDRASGHQFVNMYGSEPPACFPLKVEKAGMYQVIITAKGQFAGGAYPTVGLVVDNDFNFRTNVPLMDDMWQRVTLGIPVRLEKGDRVITPYFLNDFYAPVVPADRNLFLDMIEVVRIEEPGPSGEGSDSGGMNMAMAGGGRSVWHAVRVAFQEPLDGRTLTGLTEINGYCWWRGMEGRRQAPRVTLLLNGEPISSQRSAVPKFWLHAALLQEGENRVQMAAELETGERATTPVQVVNWKPPKDMRKPPGAYMRFTVRDEAWNSDVRKLWSNADDPPERVAARFNSNGKGVLTLPAHMTGKFLVMVEGRGWDFEGPAIAEVVLIAGKTKVKVGDVKMPGWWQPESAGVVDLPEGEKKLSVAFTNDHYKPDVGDRNMGLVSVILLATDGVPDTAKPRVTVKYPKDGHEVWMQDAVVAEASDDGLLNWAELVVDGKPTGIRAETLAQTRPLILPLLARTLAPGEHTVAVIACDFSGNQHRSKERTIRVLAEAPQAPGAYDRAVHLLNRFAYGPCPEDLSTLLVEGEDAWLDARFSRDLQHAGDATTFVAACSLFGNDVGEYDVMGRDAFHALASPNSVRARFTRFTENHFNTWIRKTGGTLEWQEHARFKRLGMAPFPDLLMASATSPTMLQYLDQVASYARSLNENYAREIMELHSVGVHGGYSQADVTALANLITGWMFSYEGDGRSGGFQLTRYVWRFDPALCDGRPQRFYGMNFPKAKPSERYDRARLAIELLAAHPSTAKFVCAKIVSHYVVHPAPADLVDELVPVFLETHGDLRAVLKAVARHPRFQTDGRGEKVAQPFDFATRLSRATPFKLPWQVIELCNRSGAGMFDRSTPDGYQEEDSAWTSTNALLQRWRFARQNEWALATVIPSGLRWTAEPATPEVRQMLVDLCAVRFTGRVLGESSNQAALEVLEGVKGNRDELAMTAASTVASLPECNLR